MNRRVVFLQLNYWLNLVKKQILVLCQKYEQLAAEIPDIYPNNSPEYFTRYVTNYLARVFLQEYTLCSILIIMRLVYSVHAKRRMRQRKISSNLTKEIVTTVSIHPIRDRDFTSRTTSGRWEYEKKS